MRSDLVCRPGAIEARLSAMSLAILVLSTLAVPIRGNGQEPKDLQGLVLTEPRPVDYAEVAGLPPGTHAEVLTLERAYTLALVKGRAPRKPLAETLEPKVLGEQAARFGMADFARFREEFFQSTEPLADQPEVNFRDPSASMFSVLKQLMVVENARRDIQSLEDLIAIAKQLLMGEAETQTRFALDRLDSELEKTRRVFSNAREQYRDRLDALKVELGLSPHAPIIADAAWLAPFRGVFAGLDRWQRDPDRRLEDLPSFVNRLAPLECGVLDFLTERPKLADLAADPARLEPVLLATESLAIKNRGGNDPGGRIGLQVRRRIRRIVDTHSAYESAKRELVTLIRLKDHEFEKLLAPPVAEPIGPAIPIKRRDLITLNVAINECENHLVSHWASFQTDRLALARELRLLPAIDWVSLYASLGVQLDGNAPPQSKKP